MLVVYIAMCTVYTYILKLALYSIMQDKNAIIYMVIIQSHLKDEAELNSYISILPSLTGIYKLAHFSIMPQCAFFVQRR